MGLNMFEHNFNSSDKSVLYIHWYFSDRDSLILNTIEKFHFLMLQKYKLNDFFDKIIFVIAQNADNESNHDFIKKQIFGVFSEEKVIIHFITNDIKVKEKTTFKMMIEDLYRNQNDINYYYIHFKGVSRIDSYNILDILFWVYLCYLGLFRKIKFRRLGEYAMCSYIHKNPEGLKSQWYYYGVDKRLMFPDYHNSGSFQAYKAKSFIKCAENLGLNEKDICNIIDGGTPYVVEWLLTSIFPPEMIDCLEFNPTHEYLSYFLFSSNQFSQYKDGFLRIANIGL